MDVTRILEADHREAERLIEQIKAAEGDDRLPHVEALADALRNHMELEETTIYPCIKEVLDQDALDEANTEHELARGALADTLRLAPDQPGFGAALETLAAALRHHIADEESDLFPAVRASDAASEALATPFLQRRLQLGMEVTASALTQACSKEELQREAEQAGIEISPNMRKDQLAEALAAKMAS